MKKKVSILTVGANPAWQKALRFADLQMGMVNRADDMISFASGKGINFCRAARIWGKADTVLVQFIGGDNGKLVLDDLAREGLSAHSIEVTMPTRCCTTCLNNADDSMTELIEPSLAPDPASRQAALDFIGEEIKQSSGLALCGQLPGKMDIDFYCQCVKMAAAQGIPVLIDSYRQLAAVLKNAQDVILKINTEELQALTGIADVNTAIDSLFSAYDLRIAAVTAGGGTAYMKCSSQPDTLYKFDLPKLAKIINPVGSGDTTSAVYFSEILANTPPAEAFARALAAASANCLSMKCGEYSCSEAENIFNNISINQERM